ncbi:hypothetical protein ABDJ25_34950 [Streptomyces actinocidus]
MVGDAARGGAGSLQAGGAGRVEPSGRIDPRGRVKAVRGGEPFLCVEGRQRLLEAVDPAELARLVLSAAALVVLTVLVALVVLGGAVLGVLVRLVRLVLRGLLVVLGALELDRAVLEGLGVGVHGLRRAAAGGGAGDGDRDLFAGGGVLGGDFGGGVSRVRGRGGGEGAEGGRGERHG